MSISSDIFTALSSATPITALVGTRISPYVRNATTQTFPALVFEVSSTAIESDSSGTGAGFTSELSVTALSRSYLEADEVAQEVYDELVGHSDSTACIALITPTTITRDQEMPYDGSQDLVYRTTVEFSVVHGNPI